jgi:Cd2+/Zn2+-exporting ATPase
MAKDQEWQVTGMDCAACAGKIRAAVARLPGASEVTVSLLSEKLRLSLDEAQTPKAEVARLVESLGYGLAPVSAKGAPPRAEAAPHPHHDHDHDHDRPAPVPPEGQAEMAAETGSLRAWLGTPKMRLVLLTGGLCALAALVGLLRPDLAPWAFGFACLFGLAPVARRATAALRHGQPFTIEALMTLAALGAIAIGAQEEAAIVVFLFALGEALEGLAANRARAGIRALVRLVPKTALVETPEGLKETPAESLRPGQILSLRPGDRIAADGTILEGLSAIDESPVTGESLPRSRGPGDPVFAGSINTEAALRIRVEKPASETVIARILRLVEEAEAAKAPTERFIERFSRWYMPAILGLSVAVILGPPLALGADWGVWTYRGLALLLIGCPCALVLSVPAAIASALAAGARQGLLLKGGAVIETVAGLRHIAFDKTGTLTHGRPEITDIEGLGLPPEAVLTQAAAVEAGSSHPLAQAILRRAEGLALPKATGARVLPGRGVEAEVAGQRLTLSSPRHALDLGLLPPEAAARAADLEAEGKTVAVLFAPDRALGLVALRDAPRAEAAAALADLRTLGLTPCLLTGDNPRTAAAIAGALGLDFQAEMLPEDKLAAIRRLGAQGGVMMVGDGINDAPALKQADVGLAMGSGTDVALETADAALLRNRLEDVPALIRLARATMANIRQNIALALGLKAVFLVTSLLGLTGLWIAILADTGATVLVTLNALRLLRAPKIRP